MELGLAGKAVLVTGASRGIGRACALAFAREGCRVGLVARGAAELAGAADEARAAGAPASHPLAFDLATETGCGAAAAAARAALGRVDVLVNNVGGRSRATFFGGAGLDPAAAPLGPADVAAALDLSLFAGLRLALHLLPDLTATGEGAIVFITSIWGREAGGAPAYNIAKAAEQSLAKALAREALPRGLRVNAVAPGSILFPGGSWDRRLRESPAETQDFVRRDLPGGRFGRPEEVADVVTFLASPRASWIAGACIPVDGAQSRAY